MKEPSYFMRFSPDGTKITLLTVNDATRQDPLEKTSRGLSRWIAVERPPKSCKDPSVSFRRDHSLWQHWRSTVYESCIPVYVLLVQIEVNKIKNAPTKRIWTYCAVVTRLSLGGSWEACSAAAAAATSWWTKMNRRTLERGGGSRLRGLSLHQSFLNPRGFACSHKKTTYTLNRPHSAVANSWLDLESRFSLYVCSLNLTLFGHMTEMCN